MQKTNNNLGGDGVLKPIPSTGVDKTPKSLILQELESLVKKSLAMMTNQMYGRNIKFSYYIDWTKGDAMIDNGKGHKTKDYYVMTMSMVDKNKSIEGVRIPLYITYYPVTIGFTNNKLLEQAYRDLLLNGMQSLVNTSYGLYIEQQEQEAVKPEDITASDVAKADLLSDLQNDAKGTIIK